MKKENKIEKLLTELQIEFSLNIESKLDLLNHYTELYFEDSYNDMNKIKMDLTKIELDLLEKQLEKIKLIKKLYIMDEFFL